MRASASTSRSTTGLPFGHCADKLTLPVGGQCALNVRSGTAQLLFSDYGAPR
jgi:muramoyltetrapeptide carboxypeptidase LdcA involved in peptidoglycan recycling